MAALLVGFNGESRDRLPTGTEHRGLCGDESYEGKKQHPACGCPSLARGKRREHSLRQGRICLTTVDFYGAYSERADRTLWRCSIGLSHPCHRIAHATAAHRPRITGPGRPSAMMQRPPRRSLTQRIRAFQTRAIRHSGAQPAGRLDVAQSPVRTRARMARRRP
jgi:hypothetical protein